MTGGSAARELVIACHKMSAEAGPIVENDGNSPPSGTANHFFMSEQAWHSIGTWRWIVGTHRIILSSKIGGVFGLEPHASEITLDHGLSRILPEDRPLVREVLLDIADGRRTPIFMLRALHVSGQVRHLRCKANPRMNRLGHVTEVVIAFGELVVATRPRKLMAS